MSGIQVCYAGLFLDRPELFDPPTQRNMPGQHKAQPRHHATLVSRYSVLVRLPNLTFIYYRMSSTLYESYILWPTSSHFSKLAL